MIPNIYLYEYKYRSIIRLNNTYYINSESAIHENVTSLTMSRPYSITTNNYINFLNYSRITL